MEIPVCPGCGGSSWESVEDYSGGSKGYELCAAGWRLVNDRLELRQTDYSCLDCGYDPSDHEDGDELLEMLNDIDITPTPEAEYGGPSGELQLRLWQGRTAA
jgi:hypothetical protein